MELPGKEDGSNDILYCPGGFVEYLGVPWCSSFLDVWQDQKLCSCTPVLRVSYSVHKLQSFEHLLHFENSYRPTVKKLSIRPNTGLCLYSLIDSLYFSKEFVG